MFAVFFWLKVDACSDLSFKRSKNALNKNICTLKYKQAWHPSLPYVARARGINSLNRWHASSSTAGNVNNASLQRVQRERRATAWKVGGWGRRRSHGQGWQDYRLSMTSAAAQADSFESANFFWSWEHVEHVGDLQSSPKQWPENRFKAFNSVTVASSVNVHF